jgi:hypothetical protein
MSDDKTKTGPQDAKLVNVNEDYELRYWTGKFGVSPEKLKEAVKAVGTSANKVGEFLQTSRQG